MQWIKVAGKLEDLYGRLSDFECLVSVDKISRIEVKKGEEGVVCRIYLTTLEGYSGSEGVGVEYLSPECLSVHMTASQLIDLVSQIPYLSELTVVKEYLDSLTGADELNAEFFVGSK